MTYADLVRRRIRTQRLTRSEFTDPAQVISWLGAVQAQDYAGATWAVGQRACGLTDVDVDRAFDEGRILRTHVLRPTWHFVTPADIRWILALSAPRVHAFNGSMYRSLELDRAVLAQSRRVFERALADGQYLTRAELRLMLARADIHADRMRLAYIVMHAELEGVVCSGPRRGKQFTYALLDGRVPCAKVGTRNEMLAELTRRYFRSHGPATARDFAWWSGLTLSDVRSGLDMIAPELTQERLGDLTYWRSATTPMCRSFPPSAYLLPNYDECLVAYRDRELVPVERTAIGRASDRFAHHVLLNGRLAGTWSRTLTASTVTLTVASYTPLSGADTRALAAAADRYRRFLGLSNFDTITV